MAEPEVVKLGSGVSGTDPDEMKRRAKIPSGGRGKCSCGHGRRRLNRGGVWKWACSGCNLEVSACTCAKGGKTAKSSPTKKPVAPVRAGGTGALAAALQERDDLNTLIALLEKRVGA